MMILIRQKRKRGTIIKYCITTEAVIAELWLLFIASIVFLEQVWLETFLFQKCQKKI